MYRRCVTEQAAKRQAEVEECLLELMAEDHYAAVSVSSICLRSGISRTAFYRYYKNKDACLDALLDRTLLTGGVFGSRTPLERMLRFWQSQRSLLDVLVRSGLTDRLVLRLVRYVQAEEPHIMGLMNSERVHCDEDVLVFTFSGIMSLIILWHTMGYPLSEEEMTQKLQRLLTQPLVRVE